MSRNLLVRIAFAAVAIPLAALVLWLGGWWLAVVLAALGALGAREVFDFARKQGIEPLAALGYIGAAAVPLATLAGRATAVLYVGTLWLLAHLVAAMRLRGPKGRPLAAVAVTLFGSLYPSVPLAFLLAIRHGQGADARPLASLGLTLFPLVLTWICDTAAHAAGSQLGGPKLAAVLSPNKTWSGAVGGVVGAVAAALLLGLLVLNRQGWTFAAWQLATVGGLIGVVAQVGDVAESLLKREAGVKDSSALIPGHGGVLDRLDSLYFVIPTTAGLYALYGVI